LQTQQVVTIKKINKGGVATAHYMKGSNTMKFHTKRYDIKRVDGQDFNEGITYEVNLKDGYAFSDGSCLNYATDFEDLRALIADIERSYTVKYYFDEHNGKCYGKSFKITKAKALKHLSESQIKEGIDAKKADPNIEVSYMTAGGFIRIEL
jgi:hypothetical protein